MLKCPDEARIDLSSPKRRTHAEVQQLVAEFRSRLARLSCDAIAFVRRETVFSPVAIMYDLSTAHLFCIIRCYSG